MSGIPLTERAPHRARRMAESFGVNADRYDRARPRYPESAVARILSASPGPALLDVGCGTGIAARQLRAAGARVLGVEPDARMAAFARRDGIEVEVATLETWDAAGRVFDAVLAAQSWHWVDPVAGAAKAGEVLRPRGVLAVLRNDGQPPPEVVEAVAAAYRRVLPGSAAERAATRSADEVFAQQTAGTVEGVRATGLFGEPDTWQVTWEQRLTHDEWLDLVPTSDGHTLLPAAELEEVLAALRAGLGALGDGFVMRYTTTVFLATRLDVNRRGE